MWNHDPTLDRQVSHLVSATGGITFREKQISNLLNSARNEQPMLILLGPGNRAKELERCVEELASHPDTRWTPIVLLCDQEGSHSHYAALLDRGATSIIDCRGKQKLLQAQFRALHRSALRLASSRSTRLTDEKTGFYHQSFLLDQLHVLCKKKRRDGISFCVLFLEIRGLETEVHKAALEISNTVRGADLFGRWEENLFAVLLPNSQPNQAHLLVQRCMKILSGAQVAARAALVFSDSGVVEAEAIVEASLNALDEAWSADSFLWTWENNAARPEPLEELR